MNLSIPCVLMRGGTSRGPYFLREWLPADDAARDQALIGAIGASDPLQLDGVGGGSTLNSKVAIVSRSERPGCDLDYLFAQVGVGHRSVDTRPNCGNMLSGVVPFAIEQGLIPAREGTTTARVYNVNTNSRIDITVCTPGGKITYEGDARIDGVAGTAAPVLMNFLDAWGAVTGKVFPTGQRIDVIDGVEVTCIDAAMPLMIARASSLGVSGRERPEELDANEALMTKLEQLRLQAGVKMGLGDVTDSVIPKPVLVSEGESSTSIASRYFTPHKCHASHAATGAIGVSTAFSLPGTVAATGDLPEGKHDIAVIHPAGRLNIEVDLQGNGEARSIKGAALLRTARKIFEGTLQLPGYVFPERETAQASEPRQSASHEIRIIVPTSPGGGNDTMARMLARELGPVLGQDVVTDNRAGANGSVASEYVAAARPDGQTLLWGYTATHAINPALQPLRYDPISDFAPIGLVGQSPTLLVVPKALGIASVGELIEAARAGASPLNYSTAGAGTAPHMAGELFQLQTGIRLRRADFEGAAPAISALAAGQTQLMFPSLFSALPYLRSGRLTALAVAAPERLPELPDVPTLAEAGVPGIELTQWYGLFAPPGTPDAAVTRLSEGLKQTLQRAETAARMREEGARIQNASPTELGEFLRSEQSKWRGIIDRAGLRAQTEPEALAES